MVTSDAMYDCYSDGEYETTRISEPSHQYDDIEPECGDCEEVEDDE